MIKVASKGGGTISVIINIKIKLCDIIDKREISAIPA